MEFSYFCLRACLFQLSAWDAGNRPVYKMKCAKSSLLNWCVYIALYVAYMPLRPEFYRNEKKKGTSQKDAGSAEKEGYFRHEGSSPNEPYFLAL